MLELETEVNFSWTGLVYQFVVEWESITVAPLFVC